MEALRILEKPESLTWDYDEEGDVLYISVGEPRPAVTIDAHRVARSGSARARSGDYANLNVRGQLAVLEESVLRGWQLRNDLILFSGDGAALDTVKIPVVRRLGVRADARELIDVERIGMRGRLEGFSRLRQLYPLPDGRVAFTHHDQRVLKLEPTPILTVTVWVGVLSADLRRACVDTMLPVSQDARSMETFRGDTLFQLDRRVVDDRLQTWIRMFRVDTDACDWIPLGGPGRIPH